MATVFLAAVLFGAAFLAVVFFGLAFTVFLTDFFATTFFTVFFAAGFFATGFGSRAMVFSASSFFAPRAGVWSFSGMCFCTFLPGFAIGNSSILKIIHTT
ncbi:hypothetical protein JST99_02135 [Candidatus Dependentiae bacterium]|nr:hypothetical protein [Candidatus Dependentiae bacterium]